MKPFDRYLQKVRIRYAEKFIRKNDIVFDIGCSDGALFKKLSNKIKYGYGIDPDLIKPVITDTYELIPGTFPDVYPRGVKFNVVTLLAVLEHFPPGLFNELNKTIYKLLKPGGRIIITVPSPQVDYILNLLLKLRLIDGMDTDAHYGFNPNKTVSIFSNGFKLIKKKRFQFGLNNLFVFEKTERE